MVPDKVTTEILFPYEAEGEKTKPTDVKLYQIKGKGNNITKWILQDLLILKLVIMCSIWSGLVML